jgi:RNA polymerase sigma-70 factor (ECF subfamily)
MSTSPSAAAAAAAAAAARASYGRLVAFLAARSHDIAAAEDALGDAFAAALRRWPTDGVPAAPEAWLLTAARRRLADAWRHRRVEAGAAATLEIVFGEIGASGDAAFPDERLKLMFVCAHPAVDPSARPALMLQAVLGLDAARIASAFLVSPAALSQRLVRAKNKIRTAAIGFEVPEAAEWPERLADVLEAVYAAYGTGWDDVAGTDAQVRGLAAEALELAALLTTLLPAAAEAWGLLALLAFCESRGAARRDAAGEYVPLAAQDTSRWDADLRRLGETALAKAAALGTPGAFQLEAAIQSAHSQRRLGAVVPESAIVELYEALVALRPTIGAIVSRACAVADAYGAAAGRAALDAIDPREVRSYQPYWAALAHLAAASGDAATARDARERAVGLSTDPAVRRFLLRAE